MCASHDRIANDDRHREAETGALHAVASSMVLYPIMGALGAVQDAKRRISRRRISPSRIACLLESARRIVNKRHPHDLQAAVSVIIVEQTQPLGSPSKAMPTEDITSKILPELAPSEDVQFPVPL